VTAVRAALGSDAGASADGYVLGASDCTKAFGGLVAVSGVDFEIPERSIVSIIGPNGAGKTTFFNMLTGLYKPTGGRIRFLGRDVTGTRPDKIVTMGMARMFQNIRLFKTMSALDNVLKGKSRWRKPQAAAFSSVTRWPRRSSWATRRLA
jgi:branched-chain amino acid transport system ATP-binding protein